MAHAQRRRHAPAPRRLFAGLPGRSLVRPRPCDLRAGRRTDQRAEGWSHDHPERRHELSRLRLPRPRPPLVGLGRRQALHRRLTMKFTLSWLKDHLETTAAVPEIVAAM